MNKVYPRPEPALYEADFVSWTERQCQLLRAAEAGDRGALGRVDWINLATEIEELGRQARKTVLALMTTLVEHLLKLALSPSDNPRNGWRETITRCRLDLAREVEDSGTLRAMLADPETLDRAWTDARVLADRALAAHGERAELPETCPFTLDQILSVDWEPANRFGL